jgi:hypothetical protein
VRFATENPTWGYTRIRGGLKCVGHDVSRNTIKAILKDHGIEPAPERGTKMAWKTFLAAHWDGIAAADFFTVEVLTLRGHHPHVHCVIPAGGLSSDGRHWVRAHHRFFLSVTVLGRVFRGK